MGFLDKAKDLLAQTVENNIDTVGAAIDKAGEFVDSKTEGKYTDTIHKARDEAKKAAGTDAGADKK